jgi:Flp pilus assembly protein TadD
MNNGPVLACLAVLAVLVQPSAVGAHQDGVPRSVYPVFTAWNPTATLARGIDLWANAEKVKALRAFEDATKVCPRDPIAWHNLGVALMFFTRTVAALDAFRHERFLSPTAPAAYYAMGDCLMALGQYPEAENAFVMAVVEYPGEWRYWEALARAFEKTGKRESAQMASRNAARLKPRHIPKFRGFETTTKDILRGPSAGVPIPWINWSYRH